MKKLKFSLTAYVMFLMIVCLMFSACGNKAGNSDAASESAANESDAGQDSETPGSDDVDAASESTTETEKVRTELTVISEMVSAYVLSSDDSDETIEKCLTEIDAMNQADGEKWRSIINCLKFDNSDLVINYGKLDENLADDNSLCIVVLGYQLNADGSIKPELEKRLDLALACAEQYPNAYVLCTGGGTASDNKEATEADKMAEWLKEKGLSEDRIIIENESLTTGQNAMFSYKILREQYPQVNSVAIVSSDYHIPWGMIVFEAEFILTADKDGHNMKVVSNAAVKTNVDSALTLSSQANDLVVIAGANGAADVTE